MNKLTILLRTDNGDVPIELSLDTFRELVGWLYNHKHPQEMTLTEAATILIELGTMVGGEMIKGGYLQSGGKLMWAASRLRQHVLEQESGNGHKPPKR